MYEFGDTRLSARFWQRVAVNDETGCWIWTGATINGYGRYALLINGERSQMAHRAAYMALVGPVGVENHIDHLCQNPSCANPDHLEAVTVAENMRRRGLSLEEVAQRQSSDANLCKNGHPLTPENDYVDPRGWHACRQCNTESARRRYHPRGKR